MGELPRYYEYTVQPGDTLASIIYKAYGWSPPSRSYGEIRDTTLALNPHVNPDRPMPWDTMCLAADPRLVFGTSTPRPLQFMSPGLTPEQRQGIWALTWLEHHSGLLTSPGGVALGAAQNLMSGGNVGLIEQVGERYAQYKAGRITKGQYDGARRGLINQLQQNIGPLERWLFGGRAREHIRIARSGAIPRTAHIDAHAARLRRLGSLAAKGGIVLTGVGIAAACRQIAHTMDRKEKNEIFVDTVASTGTSMLLGGAVGFFLVSSPIGWGTALVLAAGSAYASYHAGRGAATLYTSRFERIDLLSGTGLDRICR